MNPQHNGDPSFRVGLPGKAAAQLAAILRRADQLGHRAEIVASARYIHLRLRSDPRVFGEPTKSRNDAQIEDRRAAVGPLVVYYGVHQDQPEVFIREFRDLL